MSKLAENLKFLKKEGFNVANYKSVENIRKAMKVSKKMKFPLVLKISSEIHKRKAGGVITDIHNKKDLKELGKKMVSNLKNIDYDGLIIQEQIKGAEVIVGLKKDPVFGQVILFGSGGTLTEIIDDVCFRVCPIKIKDAKEMINETKAKQLLKDMNTKKLEKLLVKVSKLKNIKEMDLNPVIIDKNNCWIVDARIKRN